MTLLVVCAAGCGTELASSPAGGRSAGVAVSAERIVEEDKPEEARVTIEPESTIEPEMSETEAVAANPLGGCGMCHVDVEDEFIGSLHDTEAVGCVKCHGPSKGHSADENNDVLPDHIFAGKEIDKMCEECHECSRSGPRSLDVGADGQRKLCTECHGAHKLVLVKADEA